MDRVFPQRVAKWHACLDLLKVQPLTPVSERPGACGILLEIAETGGLIQTSDGIPEGSAILLDVHEGQCQARVTRCDQDEFGFLIRFAVEEHQPWYPDSFRPECLREEPISSSQQGA